MATAPKNQRLDDGLDGIDRHIVDLLTADARMSNSQLALRVGVAQSTAHARVKALEARGVIRGFHADIDPARLGCPVQAMVAVRLRSHDRRHIDAFAAAVPTLTEVVQSYHVAGADDYLLHVAVPSSEYLREWLIDNVTTHPAVASSQTTLIFGHSRLWRREGSGD